ncbi:uncharacterized protein VDAG_00932 [Verticillium dahliae VdLs.17]|uniref:Uncharacterized protein n=1 Tax=Verticillium dahliae (strain VdLs.17 / ATCC MYA-4575 / FGSC 10137) TaxID=498257 RepID=G2WT09_VERDV|nr:uncharacterized protein VDAG_00932 [Verticillium dahliae VdLs.17]EGY17250.1 hypothetical protein VDAG_00932 [Verticillium dahliae VdLs.17]KAH6701650.1 hypothetical protein EV126DRAFT_339324 [Verticillium dahliae]
MSNGRKDITVTLSDPTVTDDSLAQSRKVDWAMSLALAAKSRAQKLYHSPDAWRVTRDEGRHDLLLGLRRPANAAQSLLLHAVCALWVPMSGSTFELDNDADTETLQTSRAKEG